MKSKTEAVILLASHCACVFNSRNTEHFVEPFSLCDLQTVTTEESMWQTCVLCEKKKTVTHCPGQECHDWHYRHVLFYTTGPAGNVHLAGLRCVLFRVQSMENFSSGAYMYHRVSSTQRNSVRPCWHTCFRGRRGRDLRVKFQRKLCIRGFSCLRPALSPGSWRWVTFSK